MSLESWKSFFEYGGVTVLFLTFVFGTGALIFSNRINEQQKRVNNEQAERLRTFDSDLTDAKKQLSVQQERAAKAELQLEEIRERQRPRKITDEQANIIKSALASARGQSVTVFALIGETEISDFASRLTSVLRTAGLVVANRQGTVRDEPNPVGITLTFGTNKEALAKLLHAAFTKAGLGIGPLPAARAQDANEIVIMVGAKN